jgi:hypothetical protein
MSSIHFVNGQPPQTLKHFIKDFKSEMNEARPLRIALVVTPATQSITLKVTFRLGFYQLSQSLNDSRELYEIKDVGFFNTSGKHLNPEEIEGMMHEIFAVKVSHLITQGILQKNPDFKKLKYLKIKVLNQDPSFLLNFKSTIKIDWIEDDSCQNWPTSY